MDYELLIRNGRVVDGSGLPSYIADVGIKDGKFVDIGRLKGSAARTIDADGLVVSPGFIDHHTHMDGQILWDPFGTCEPQHGVTSIIMGNCGLALAPIKNGESARTVSVMEFQDGKVIHQTQYFAEPFEVPAWRAQWVERIA